MHTAGLLGARFGRLERVSLLIALAWAAGLVAVALVAPVYESAGVTSQGTVTHGSETFVAVNGWGAMAWVSAPLIAAAVTAYALWRRAGRAGAGVLAWTVTGLLACFSLVAILTIGVFVLPVTGALIVACSARGGRLRPER